TSYGTSPKLTIMTGLMPCICSGCWPFPELVISNLKLFPAVDIAGTGSVLQEDFDNGSDS
ncbi:hypothetical protein, partial [Enterobacter hormaechei]|uniref:hypothetical protein n=1 Tax=Enterobacter hormaechei TaxID=158836 RepID=UPI001CC2A3F7